MFQGGYMGKYLFVDLTESSVEIRDLNEEYARLFVGGPALGARMLWDFMEPHVDAKAPESVCGFIAGPFNGGKVLFGGRYTFVCKSPVYNGFNDANSGGFFGPELKKAGFDALFIKGKASKPVYLLITNDNCEIRDASHLWGLDYFETEEKLSEELKQKYGYHKVRFAGVGPAGERGSHIAAIMNDQHRAAARGGGGGVLGSKMCKIIAVTGTKKIPVFDPDTVKEMNRTASSAIMDSGVESFRQHGTGEGTPGTILCNDGGTKNWGGMGEEVYTPEEADMVGSPYADRKYMTGRYACSACALGCGAFYDVNDGTYPIGHTSRPEYETAAVFTSMIAVKDPSVYIYCNDLCNRYGFDTISAGATIAWVMECYENGALTKEDLDGIEAHWGSGEATVALLKKMGTAEGCGKVLLHGSQYAADLWQKGQEYLMTYSGIEPGIHDARFFPGMARTFQFDPTPGRHVKGGSAYLYEDDKYDFSDQGPHTGKADVESMAYTELENASGLCQMANFYGGLLTGVELWEAMTGWKLDLNDFGRRSFLMRMAINVREGLRKADYTASPRLVGKPPFESGPLAGVTIDNEKLADIFFEELGCDMENYWPYKETLQKLGGMDDVAVAIGV